MFSTTDYDKLQQIMKESPEKNELLTRLLESHRMEISTISHEIRNPLTLVYSTLQLIETQHPEVTSFRHWTEMHQDIEYMKQLLEELSSYNNGERLHLSSVDTESFFQTISLSFAASLLDTDIEFTSRISPELPETMLDSTKIKQTILNLLGNARDAVLARTDNMHPSISMDVALEDSHILISVSDTGCGISSEDMNSIFEPFVTHKKTGTGLGLAVAQRIVHAHHGNICATSTVGMGSTFTITLPVQQDTQQES